MKILNGKASVTENCPYSNNNNKNEMRISVRSKKEVRREIRMEIGIINTYLQLDHL